MKLMLVRFGTAAAAALAIALAGCGGGGGDAPTPPPVDTTPPPPTQSVAAALSAAAAQSANDTATAPTAVLRRCVQGAGVPAVTVNSAPKVNFAVFSDGAIKKGLALSNVSFTFAKLVPGTNGEPDKWVNYVYRKEVGDRRRRPERHARPGLGHAGHVGPEAD